MVRAVIFDLDDTLYPEKQYIESGFKHIAKILNHETNIDKDKIYNDLLNIFEQDSRNVFNNLLKKYNIDYTDDRIMKLVNDYRGHLPKISFYDDVIPCLHNLKHKGIKTGIITDGYLVSQRQKINALKAYDYFDKIILTDELGREFWKPHPKAFELMKEALSISFEEMMYIGDNPEKDFYISEVYPIITVRINRDGVYKNKSYLNGIKERYRIYSLLEVNKIVNQLLSI